MPETVHIRRDLPVIQVESTGDITERELFETLEIIIDIYNTQKINKVLINATGQTSLPSTMSIFRFGTSISDKDIAYLLKFAVVAGRETIEDIQFLEHVVHNRGGYMEIFDSPGAALDWLMK